MGGILGNIYYPYYPYYPNYRNYVYICIYIYIICNVHLRNNFSLTVTGGIFPSVTVRDYATLHNPLHTTGDFFANQILKRIAQAKFWKDTSKPNASHRDFSKNAFVCTFRWLQSPENQLFFFAFFLKKLLRKKRAWLLYFLTISLKNHQRKKNRTLKPPKCSNGYTFEEISMFGLDAIVLKSRLGDSLFKIWSAKNTRVTSCAKLRNQ